jgi:DNA polymerase-3 subunit alpha
VSFPRRDDDAPEEDDGPREPTLFLNEAIPLLDAVKADTKQLFVRVPQQLASEAHLRRMAELFAQARGDCPVALQIELKNGTLAHIAAGKRVRVEVGDLVLAGLERIFGSQIAELR